MSTHVETKLVDSNNIWHTSDTPTQTVTLDAAPSENDIVIAWCHQNTNATISNLAALGFDNVIVNVEGSGYSRMVAWKRAGAAEPSSYGFTTTATSTGNDGFAAVTVYSGVDTTTALDTDYDDETITSTSTTDFAISDVSTKAADTRIVALVFGGSGPSITMTPPTGYTERVDDGVINGPWGSLADKAEAAPGNYSPGQFTQSSSGTGVTYVLTLRDSSATYIEQSGVTWNPPTGYSYVEYKGDVIPENSILHKHRGTHTGTSGATLTDSGVSLSADEWKDYRVTNWTDNDSTGIIGTHASGSGPFSLSSALSGGAENDFDNGDSYDITTPVDSGDQIGYVNTEDQTGTNQFEFDYYLIDATDGVATSDQTATVTATGTPFGKTGDISLTVNGSPTLDITGDAGSGGSSGMSAILGDNVLGDNVLGDIVAASSGPTAALTGTAASGMTEVKTRNGGETIILTLTDDTWVADGATFNAQRQNIIDGLDAASSPTNGWNNEVRDKLDVSAVVRTSDTVVTITLSAQTGYDISAQEVITATIPSTAVSSSTEITATPTFTIDFIPYVIMAGSANGADWTRIRDTGATLSVGLVDDTFIAAGTGPIGTTAQSNAFVQSFVAAASPAGGWNNQISLTSANLTRFSDQVALISIPATAGYDPQETETITGTVQAAILTTYGSDISTGSFQILFSTGEEMVSDLTSDITSDLTSNIAS